MTSMNHIVIDVSSDEEDDKLVDYSDWLDEVLEVSDEKPKSTTGHQKSISSEPTVEVVDGDDDDCVVLDDDPYKTTEKETEFDTCETDEVLVVGQKGEIACRDFPHPRHACAKYPFKSTSHQQYCEMCHCYVCDIRAPCLHWCIGISSIDHCHANDKEDIWKSQRESIRAGKMLPQIQRITQPRSILIPQNSSSPLNKFGIRPCSTSTRVATHPNTYTRPGYTTELSKTYPQNPGLQPPAAQVFLNHRGGSYNGNPSPQEVSSNPKIPGIQPPPVHVAQNHRGGSYNVNPSPLAVSSNSKNPGIQPPLVHVAQNHRSGSYNGKPSPLAVSSNLKNPGIQPPLVHVAQNHRGSSFKGKPSPLAVSSNPKNPGLQPRAVHVAQNHRGVSCNGNPNPLAVSSHPFKWTRRPSRGVYHPVNSKHTIPQGSQYSCNGPPTALQGNPQQVVNGYISTVPESRSKVYAKHFSRNMYSGNVQTNAVPSEAPNPPVNQQQQSGISKDNVLSEFEDWLMDNSNLNDPICPLSSQDNAASFTFDFETFLE